MNAELRPLRKLNSIEKLLLRFRRCPTCHKKLVMIHEQKAANWHNQPAGLGMPVGRGGYGSHDGMMTGNITKLRNQRIPHCPGCQHTFVHGWIYPSLEQSAT